MPDASIKIRSEFDKKGVDDAQKGLKDLGSAAQASSAPMGMFGSVASGVFTGLMGWTAVIAIIEKVWTAVKAFAVDSVRAWGEAETATNKLAQALKTKGIYTQEAIKDLDDYSVALMNATTFDDEAIKGVMSSLTAFGLQGQTLKDVTKATLDLAQATGMDLDSAGKVVAKSIGSSTNALARYGIEVDSGVNKTEKAKQVIEGISALYSGQASAAVSTYEGKMKQLANQTGELQEAVGKELAPAFQDVGSVMLDVLTVVVGWFKNIADGIKTTYEFLKTVDEQTKVFTTLGKVIVDVTKIALVPLMKTLESIGWVWEKMSGFMKQYTKDHQKTTEEIKKGEEEHQKAVQKTSEFTEKQLEKQAKDQAKALDERSKRTKEFWDEEYKLAEGDYVKQKKILEKALKDHRLGHDEKVKLSNELKELETKNAEEGSHLMSKAFMESATSARFDWATAMQKIAEETIALGVKPIVNGLSEALGQFGGLSNILLGGIGGVIGSIVGGIINIFGGHSKSVAEYSKEAYDDMTKHTKEAIDAITRPRTETEKAISLVETMGQGMAEGATFTAGQTGVSDIARITGVNIEGMTVSQAKAALATRMASLPGKSSADAKAVADAQQEFYDRLDFIDAKVGGDPHWAPVIAQYRSKVASNTITKEEAGAIAFLYTFSRWGMYGNVGEQQGKLEAALRIMQETGGGLGSATLEDINTMLYYQQQASKYGYIPKAASGGSVEETGLAVIHKGETIIPANKSAGGVTININEGAFTVNGTDLMSNSGRVALAKMLSAQILKYVQQGVRAPYGAERKI
jgi:hypothetical protein